jgi:tripartite-type tricarboxylate transporter receptor subunit TctC
MNRLRDKLTGKPARAARPSDKGRPAGRNSMKIPFRLMIAAGLIALGASAARAKDYPTGPIHLLVPFPPGGSVNVIARLFGDQLTAAWKQPVVVDPKPGAGGVVATEALVRSPPDGQTLMMATVNVAIDASLYKHLPFDTTTDLTPITQVITVPNVIVVRADLPVKTLGDLIALAKKEPGKLNYSSGGSGSFPHLAMELLKHDAGIDIVHIPYKGNAPALLALLAKDVDLMSTNIGDVLQYIQAGKLRPLAVTGATREETLPNVPTVAEASVPGYAAAGWFGFFAPAKTPKPIIDKLNGQIRAALKSPKVAGYLKQQGYDAVSNTPEEFSAIMKTDIARWAVAVKASGARAD